MVCILGVSPEVELIIPVVVRLDHHLAACFLNYLVTSYLISIPTELPLSSGLQGNGKCFRGVGTAYHSLCKYN